VAKQGAVMCSKRGCSVVRSTGGFCRSLRRGTAITRGRVLYCTTYQRGKPRTGWAYQSLIHTRPRSSVHMDIQWHRSLCGFAILLYKSFIAQDKVRSTPGQATGRGIASVGSNWHLSRVTWTRGPDMAQVGGETD
jgi:hypothetical protein